MSPRHFALVSAVVAVIGVFTASCANAAVSTEAAGWYTSATEVGPGTKLAEGSSKPVTGKAVGPATLVTEIGGLPIDLESTAMSCVECKIENRKVTEKTTAIAFGSGKIKFENVKVVTPANCNVVGGEVVTKPLFIHGDWMDTSTENKHAFIQFIPQAGATTTFAGFGLSGPGCEAISGTKNITGTVFGESKNNTGVFKKAQELVFSPAIQATTGAKLSAGTKEAKFTATQAFELSPMEFFAIKP